jgi:hypothetical protein
MLFLVIEKFKDRDAGAISARFREQGRMLLDGVSYQASWVDPAGMRCFQIMEAESVELLEVWMARWKDLVEFEVLPVVTSADFWSVRG